jgi:lipopolysaccharide/colanic/teichoic acid biosynthesis glycosyltransferase
MERVVAVLLLIVLSPLFLIISLLILLTSGTPLFFLQKRVGKYGSTFWMIKFRTMQTGAETMQKQFHRQNEADGPVFKIYNDPRHTPVGRLLSHTGIDEFPQILNIIRGEMAFVGPRPFPVAEAVNIPLSIRSIRESVLPGIVFPWIYEGYHTRAFSGWMESDCTYVQTKTFLGDVSIILTVLIYMCRTVWKQCGTMDIH